MAYRINLGSCILVVVAAVMAASVGCKSGEGAGDERDPDTLIALGPCGEDNADAPAQCGQACQEDDRFPDGFCGDGFFCTERSADEPGTCMAHCDPFDPEAFNCPGDLYCTAYGRCIDASNANLDSCPDTTVPSQRITPTIHIVLDRSHSMGFTFDANDASTPKRWDVLKEVLGVGAASGGLLRDFEKSVQFGLTAYPGGGTLPSIAAEVAPRIENAAAMLDEIEDVMPDGGTPTGEALEHILNEYGTGESQTYAFDTSNPIYLLLITDGAPRLWEPHLPRQFTSLTGPNQYDRDARVFLTVNPGMELTRRQITRARSEFGIRTFVLGVGQGDAEDSDKLNIIRDDGTLEAMRAAGVFDPSTFAMSPPAPAGTPNLITYDAAELNRVQDDLDGLATYLAAQALPLGEKLDVLAAAGATNNNRHFPGTNAASFENALTSIVENAVSCELRFGQEAEIPLNRVDQIESGATIQFDASPNGGAEKTTLPYRGYAGNGNAGANAGSGWRLGVLRNKIELLGETCTMFKEDPSRLGDIVFGCGFNVLQ